MEIRPVESKKRHAVENSLFIVQLLRRFFIDVIKRLKSAQIKFFYLYPLPIEK